MSAHRQIPMFVVSQVSSLLAHILFCHSTAIQGATCHPVMLNWLRIPRLAQTKERQFKVMQR